MLAKRAGEIHVVAGEDAPDPRQALVQGGPLHHHSELLELLGPHALAALRRAQQPEPGVEQIDVGLEHRQIAGLEGVLDHRHQAAETGRLLIELLEGLGDLGDRLADPPIELARRPSCWRMALWGIARSCAGWSRLICPDQLSCWRLTGREPER